MVWCHDGNDGGGSDGVTLGSLELVQVNLAIEGEVEAGPPLSFAGGETTSQSSSLACFVQFSGSSSLYPVRWIQNLIAMLLRRMEKWQYVKKEKAEAVVASGVGGRTKKIMGKGKPDGRYGVFWILMEIQSRTIITRTVVNKYKCGYGVDNRVSIVGYGLHLLYPGSFIHTSQSEENRVVALPANLDFMIFNHRGKAFPLEVDFKLK
nr:membrane magnesium transporter [Ipomoea batatas]